MKFVVPAGYPGVYVQQTTGNGDLDLVREAEDGDAASGGTHTEALVHSTGVRAPQKNLGSQRRQGQGAFRNGQRWERLDRRQRKNRRGRKPSNCGMKRTALQQRSQARSLNLATRRAMEGGFISSHSRTVGAELAQHDLRYEGNRVIKKGERYSNS